MHLSAQNPNEIFDVVDENDCVIGQATRAEVHREKFLHRAVHILVCDSDGNVILQKRSREKDTAPGLFSTSCAGHVDAGETYEAAAMRELKEELGIDTGKTPAPKFLFAMAPQEELGWEFIRVYALTCTGTLMPNPAEIEELISLSPEKIDREMRERPQAFAESFKLVWRQVRAHGEI